MKIRSFSRNGTSGAIRSVPDFAPVPRSFPGSALRHIRANHGGGGLDDTVRLSRELARPQIATEFVLDRLVDILLVQLLRVWRTEKPAETRGTWLGVLGDPLISVALVKIHEDPAKPWTTDLLAAELATSRSTLTRRFRETTGRTPGD